MNVNRTEGKECKLPEYFRISHFLRNDTCANKIESLRLRLFYRILHTRSYVERLWASERTNSNRKKMWKKKLTDQTNIAQKLILIERKERKKAPIWKQKYCISFCFNRSECVSVLNGDKWTVDIFVSYASPLWAFAVCSNNKKVEKYNTLRTTSSLRRALNYLRSRDSCNWRICLFCSFSCASTRSIQMESKYIILNET